MTTLEQPQLMHGEGTEVEEPVEEAPEEEEEDLEAEIVNEEEEDVERFYATPDPNAPPAAEEHTRRQNSAYLQRLVKANAKRNKKRKKIWKEFPDFIWSTDSTSPHLQQFLMMVPSKLQEAVDALRVSVTLHADDLKWLVDHEGRYQCFIPPGSTRGIEILKSKKYQGKTLPQVKDMYEQSNHTILAPSPRFTSRLDCYTTQSSYENNLKQFWNFLAICGFYEDMLMLLPNPPRNAPSISYESIELFAFYRNNEPNTTLSRHINGGGAVVHDALPAKNPMRCAGMLQNYAAFDALAAAIKQIHLKHGRFEPFVPRCPDCVALWAQNGACAIHNQRNVKCYMNLGNPTQYEKYTTLRKTMVERQKKRGYRPDHASPMYPHDVKRIHSFVANHRYDICILKYYCVLLQSLHCASRFEYYSSVTHEHFNHLQQNFYITPTLIRFLVFSVKEKSDKFPILYKLGFREDFPFLCFLRHLLVFVHCSGVVGGYLYPEDSELQEAVRKLHERVRCNRTVGGESSLHEPRDGVISETPIGRAELSRWMNRRRVHNLDCPELMNLTNHSPRSTCYMFAALAGVNLNDMMYEYRHTTPDTAQGYIQDAQTIRDILKNNAKLRQEHFVPKFQPSRIHDDGNNSRRFVSVDRDRTTSVKSLIDAAIFFVERMLCVSPRDPNYYDPEYLIKKSYRMNFSEAQHSCKLLEAIMSVKEQSPFLLSVYNQGEADRRRRDLQNQEVMKKKDEQIHLLKDQVSLLTRRWAGENDDYANQETQPRPLQNTTDPDTVAAHVTPPTNELKTTACVPDYNQQTHVPHNSLQTPPQPAPVVTNQNFSYDHAVQEHRLHTLAHGTMNHTPPTLLPTTRAAAATSRKRPYPHNVHQCQRQQIAAKRPALIHDSIHDVTATQARRPSYQTNLTQGPALVTPEHTHKYLIDVVYNAHQQATHALLNEAVLEQELRSAPPRTKGGPGEILGWNIERIAAIHAFAQEVMALFPSTTDRLEAFRQGRRLIVEKEHRKLAALGEKPSHALSQWFTRIYTQIQCLYVCHAGDAIQCARTMKSYIKMSKFAPCNKCGAGSTKKST